MSQIKFIKESRVLFVKVDEEIDHHNCDKLKGKLDLAIELGNVQKLVFDFTGVSFMDSSGIGLLMGRYKKISKNRGEILVTGLKPAVKKIFQMSGLFKILKEYDSLDMIFNV